MNEMISVIVPVYNAEKFLTRSIESILNQSYQNLELILINDGSVDNSGAICKQYAAKDKRIRYYEQENHGQGYTRARGIELAKGEFIAFVDADDYALPMMYELMLKAIHKHKTDVSVCQWNYELSDGRHTIKNKIYDESFYGVKPALEFAKYLYKFASKEFENGTIGYANGVFVTPCNKLYKRTLLMGYKSTGFIGEDEEMNDYVFSQSNVKVTILPEECYYYCQNLNSTSNRPFSDKRWYFIKMLGKRAELYDDAFIVGETYKLICNIYIEYYFKANNTPPDYVKRIFEKAYRYLKKTHYCPAKFFVRMDLFRLSPQIYRKIFLR